MQLLRLHPEVATRPCDDCRKYFYDESGRVKTAKDYVDGETVEMPVERIDPEAVPCNTDKGCPKGHYSNPIELTEQEMKLYDFYHECRAVGDFPDDPLVRRTAATIRIAEDACDRIERTRELYLLMTGKQLGGI